jgi:hypothetical protein
VTAHPYSVTHTDHDSARSVLPHRDPTFEGVWERLVAGETLNQWQLTGSGVQLNLYPEVTAALLAHLKAIAEPRRSRTGATVTYRLKGRAA